MSNFLKFAKFAPIYLWLFMEEMFLRIIGRKKEAFKLMVERDALIPRSTPVELLEMAGKKGNISVLDIGCGDGGLLKIVKERGGVAIGAELSKTRAQKAREFGKVYEGDFVELDISEKFDVVIASEVLEHIPGPNAALQKIRKLMKSNAILIVRLPNEEEFDRMRKANPIEWWKLIAYRGGHAEEIDLEMAKKLLEDNKFGIVKIQNKMFPDSQKVSHWDIVAEAIK